MGSTHSITATKVKYGLLAMLCLTGTIMTLLYRSSSQFRELSTRYPLVYEVNTISCCDNKQRTNLSVTNEQKISCEVSTTDPIYRHSCIELYKPIIEPKDICASNPEMVIVVISAPKAFRHREIYRSTVLSPMKNMHGTVRVFVMGQSSEETNQQLLEESQRYGDIIQGSYVDSYENNTLKGLFWVHWTATRCPRSKFVLKLDDDVYANIDRLKQYIDSLGELRRVVAGAIFRGVVPNHDRSNKWYVDNYDKPHFPAYASGTAYIITTDILDEIFQCSISTPFLRMEDILLTGICASNNVRHMEIPNIHYQTQAVGASDPRAAFTMHSYTTEQIVQLWNMAHPTTKIDIA